MSDSFHDWYKDPRWQKKRLEILQRDGWKCLACGDSESTLHVHHLSYSGPPWAVENDQLQTLCDDCHAALGAHPKAGVFWITGSSETEEVDYSESYVFVRHCPACGSKKFKDKGSYIKCRGCGWDTGRYDAVSCQGLDCSNESEARGGDTVLFSRNIRRVYLAGKMDGDWRDLIVGNGESGDWSGSKGIHSYENLIEKDGSWAVIKNAVNVPGGRKIDLCGPYWNKDIDPWGGHGHAGLVAKNFPHSHASCNDDDWRARFATVARCQMAISRSDLFFAWIDSMDAYGTLVEIGLAAKSQCLIVLAGDPSKLSKDIWFSAALADAVIFRRCIHEAWNDLWSLYRCENPTDRNVESQLRRFAFTEKVLG